MVSIKRAGLSLFRNGGVIIIERSKDGKTRVLSLSYGKDSMACLGAIEQLGWFLDRIITVDVMATRTVSADLPDMEEFKQYADREIMSRYGYVVEHYTANKSYDEVFYRVMKKGKRQGTIMGFPEIKGNWCNGELKRAAIQKAKKSFCGGIQYIGIAADEPKRFHNLSDDKLSPLVEIGWTEQDCKKWCEENQLLNPVYSKVSRGGCWFCHLQSVGQLRLLRKEHPSLWAMMLKWDEDSPTTFRADGHTVHDFEKRFILEDEGFISKNERFRWSMIDEELNYRLF